MPCAYRLANEAAALTWPLAPRRRIALDSEDSIRVLDAGCIVMAYIFVAYVARIIWLWLDVARIICLWLDVARIMAM